MAHFRSGQWVKWRTPKPEGAHVTKDGFCVGVYYPASMGRVAINGQPKRERDPEHVAPVNADGDGIIALVGAQVVKVKYKPEELVDLQPVISMADIPEKRAANCAKGWTPQA